MTAAVSACEEAPYFAVSLPKLAAMWFVTLGLYGVYWFWKQWHAVSRRDGRKRWPFVRALLFPMIYCYPLLRDIRQQAVQAGVPCYASPALLTLAYLVLGICLFSETSYALSVLSFAQLLVFIEAQRVANAVNQTLAPAHDPNRRFSRWNISALVLGSLLWAGLIYQIYHFGLSMDESGAGYDTSADA